MSAPTAPEAQAPPPNLATPRYPLLDSLRGVAALTVFGAHAFLFLFAEGIGRDSPLVTRLDPGIAIFLLLSAFLLYRPYAQARLDGTEPPATVPFFLRRLLRIVPVYWVVLTVVALYFGFSYVAGPEGVVTYYGFLQIYDVANITRGVGQAWTICVEMTFYLLLPVWAWALRRIPAGTTKQFLRSELAILALVFVASVAWKWWIFGIAEERPGIGIAKMHVGLFTLPAFMDALTVGMALAVLSVAAAKRSGQTAFERLIDKRPWVLLAAAVALYWLSGVAGGTYVTQGAAGYILNKEVTVLVAVCIFLPAIFGGWRRGLYRRVLATKPLKWMATISYSFYLWHLAVMVALTEAGWLDDPGPVAWALGSFVISAGLATITYHAVGKPFLRLGARLPRGRSRHRLAEAGAETPSVPARSTS